MRKLATVSAAYLCAVLAAHYRRSPLLILALAGAAGLLLFALFYERAEARRRVLMLLLSAAVGLGWYCGYNALVRAPARPLYDETATVTATVTGYPIETRYGISFTARIHRENRHVRATVYADAPEAELVPGDTVTFTARFAASDHIHGEETDAFTARGIYLLAYAAGTPELTGTSRSPAFFAARLARRVEETVEKIYPAGTGAFMQALLLGNRQALYSDRVLVGDMSTVGMSHIISVSGMHMSFLVGFLALLLKRRRLFAAIALPIILLFMAMVGFAPSVVRAGVMQIFLLAAPRLRRENDPLTTLSAALLLLLLMNPNAVGSVSLQLSFGATLGLILFARRIQEALLLRVKNRGVMKRRVPARLIRIFFASLAASLSALLFTVPLAAFYFGTVSLMAVLANFVTLWAVELAFMGGLCVSLIGLLSPPVGSLLAFLAALPVRYIFGATRWLASFPFASVYVSNPYILIWIVYVYLLIVIFMVCRPTLRRAIYPVSLSALSLCLMLMGTALAGLSPDTHISALSVGQGQSIVVTSGGSTALIDCGSISGEDAASIAFKHLKSQGRNEIDLLVLTHYHADHAGGAYELIQWMPVGLLAIPEPDLDSGNLAEAIVRAAQERGVEVLYVTESVSLTLEGTEITLLAPVGDGSENERCVSVLCTRGDYDALITGDMDAALERRLLRTYTLPDIELFVVGHHGSRHSTSEQLLDALLPETAVISVGRNSFGHPSEETLQRLDERDIAVWRTDDDGTVTFRVKG